MTQEWARAESSRSRRVDTRRTREHNGISCRRRRGAGRFFANVAEVILVRII